MHAIRFSTRSLLLGVAVLAVFVAALARPALATAHAANCAFYISIFVALPAIVYRRGAVQAFWVGVALFGWGQLLLERVLLMGFDRSGMFTPPLLVMYGLFFGANPAPQYYTPPSSPVPAYAPAYPSLPSASPYSPTGIAPATPDSPGPQAGPQIAPVYVPPAVSSYVVMTASPDLRKDNFLSVGTALLTTLATWLGGLLTVYLYRTRQESPPGAN